MITGNDEKVGKLTFHGSINFFSFIRELEKLLTALLETKLQPGKGGSGEIREG